MNLWLRHAKLPLGSLLVQIISWFSSADTGLQSISILTLPLVVIANVIMFGLMDIFVYIEPFSVVLDNGRTVRRQIGAMQSARP